MKPLFRVKVYLKDLESEKDQLEKVMRVGCGLLLEFLLVPCPEGGGG